MSQLDAIALSKAVKQRLVNFALDDHFVQDPQLRQACYNLWSGSPQYGGLQSDLWIEGAFPARSVKESLHTLVQQKLFDVHLCNHLDKRNVIPRERPLYEHQYASIRAAQESYPDQEMPALVVTAGTGTGKTESFLLPVLNELFQSSTSHEEGVQCIILYPMNALVNDQVDRLYEWLQGQQRLTLFHFTSETPEDRKRADKDNIPLWDACRMRTRQEARGVETHDGKRINLADTPRGPVPDILITNYSMLEYMLCRPQDAPFFGKALKAIVLDEAHLYTGTLAAEITLLLRRLLECCGIQSEQILQIATSATMGEKVSGELESFAATLFTKRKELVRVIRGQPAERSFPEQKPPRNTATFTEIAQRTWGNQPTIKLDQQSKPELVVDAQQCLDLAQDMRLLVAEDEIQQSLHQAKNVVSTFLYHTLSHAPLIKRTADILWQYQRIPLRELTQALWNTDEEDAMRATLFLLQIGASARLKSTDAPLLPHRIHMLVRPTNGLTLCINPTCTGDPQLQLSGFGCIAEGQRDHCAYCHSAMLSLYRCCNCGSWLIAGLYTSDHTSLKPVSYQEPAKNIPQVSDETQQGFSTNIHFFINKHIDTLEAEQVIVDTKTGQCNGKGAHPRTFYAITHCPRCKAQEASDLKPFIASSSLILSILTESVLAELPPYPATYNRWLPAQGRRMLVFSDSRQAAARLGPRLTRQHEIQLFRAAMIQCMKESPQSDTLVIEDLEREIQLLVGQLSESSPSPALKQRRERSLKDKRQELQEYLVGGSMGNWVDTLENIDIIQQLLDTDTSGAHEANEWTKESDQLWKKNAQRIQAKLTYFLAREFARSTPRQTSLESLGLAEITYPGLDQLTIPENLLGILPTSFVREQLRTSWVPLLAALCDTLRSDGAVSLGSDQDNRDYQFSQLRSLDYRRSRERWSSYELCRCD